MILKHGFNILNMTNGNHDFTFVKNIKDYDDNKTWIDREYKCNKCDCYLIFKLCTENNKINYNYSYELFFYPQSHNEDGEIYISDLHNYFGKKLTTCSQIIMEKACS